MQSRIQNLSYEQALKFQKTQAASTKPDWLFFSCPPVITLGKRAQISDITLPQEVLRKNGIQTLKVDRGGLVTFHGPGQIVGFPLGSLQAHAGDTRAVRAFVDHTVGAVKRCLYTFFPNQTWVCDDPEKKGAGLWRKNHDGSFEKVLSIGIKVSRETSGLVSVKHGFCLNLFREEIFLDQSGFDCIVACGSSIKAGYVFKTPLDENLLEQIAQGIYDELRGEHETRTVHFEKIALCP